MAWFRDLSPYRYQEEPELVRPLVNVGWLENGRPFPTAPPAPELVAALYRCAEYPVALFRGLHGCDLCTPAAQDALTLQFGRSRTHGNGEIRVRGRKHDFAAPTLVVHYVEVHHYAPPAEFVDSVLERAKRLLFGWEADRIERLSEEQQCRLVDDTLQRLTAAASADPAVLDPSGLWRSLHPNAWSRAFLRTRSHEDRTERVIWLLGQARGAGLSVQVPERDGATRGVPEQDLQAAVETAEAHEGPRRVSYRRTLAYEAPGRHGPR